jgi:hypothetical protein
MSIDAESTATEAIPHRGAQCLNGLNSAIRIPACLPVMSADRGPLHPSRRCSAESDFAANSYHSRCRPWWRLPPANLCPTGRGSE